MKKIISLLSAVGILLTAVPSAAYAVDVTVDNSWYRTGGNIEKFIEEYEVEDGIVKDFIKEMEEAQLNNPDNPYYYANYTGDKGGYAGLFYREDGAYYGCCYYRYNFNGHDVALIPDGFYAINYIECDQISEEEFNTLSYKEKFEKGAEIYYETGKFPFELAICEIGYYIIYDDYDDEVVAGDLNGDNEVTVADSTYISQHLAKPDSFPLTEAQKAAADVTGGGDGVTAADALAIQKYLANETDTLG